MHICLSGSSWQIFFKTTWARGDMVSLLVQPVRLRTRPHVRIYRQSKPEAYGRDQICRDPEYVYVIPVTTQSYGEPRVIPTCLSRQGQVKDTLGKLKREGHPIQARMIN